MSDTETETETEESTSEELTTADEAVEEAEAAVEEAEQAEEEAEEAVEEAANIDPPSEDAPESEWNAWARKHEEAWTAAEEARRLRDEATTAQLDAIHEQLKDIRGKGETHDSDSGPNRRGDGRKHVRRGLRR